ncbi:hypothetical protein PH547_10925 [Rhizobium sp. CNPSo 3464]|uniref:hypothetical protein n=1 Tax=Rhizobium sp. CNPSo 3464 TaxID=3021406 RepID=UPI00254C0F79|nr:hypothetical protein [Rhizobium sp. CNPSo 3464]MDK4739387.1 hypothetical protein [Rhizobium sp. CNPSo 3464]
MALPTWFYVSVLIAGVFLCYLVEKLPANPKESLWEAIYNNFRSIYPAVVLKWILFFIIFAIGIWAPIGEPAKLIITAVIVFGTLFTAVLFRQNEWAKAAANSAAGVGALYLAWLAKFVIS